VRRGRNGRRWCAAVKGLFLLLAGALAATSWVRAEEPIVLKGQNATIRCLAFSSDGKLLATVEGDRTVRLRDAASGRELSELTVRLLAFSVAFAPDGKNLVMAGLSSVQLWDVATVKMLAEAELASPLRRRLPTFVTFSPDGKVLAALGESGGASLLDAATLKEKFRLDGHKERVMALAFSPDGKTVATGSADKTVSLWDPMTGKERLKIGDFRHAVAGVAFTGDGKSLATVTAAEEVKLWDAATGEKLATIHMGEESPSWVYRVAFAPDGHTLAFTSTDTEGSRIKGILTLWDVTAGRELGALRGPDGAIDWVAFAPDGKRVATVSADGTARLWDLASLLEKKPDK
jgi:WD40 repeat protein